MVSSIPATISQQEILQHEKMNGFAQDPKLVIELNNNVATSLKLHQSPLLDSSTKPVDLELTSQQNHDAEYWHSQFVGAQAAHFPQVPSLKDSSQICRRVVERWMTGFHCPIEDTSMTTRVWAAWAILIAAYTNSTDVVFGANILNNSSHGAHEASIDLTRGIAVVAKSLVAPVRVVIFQEERVEQVLARLQRQMLDIVQHGGLGLQEIRLLSEAAKECCMFQTLLRVRTKGTSDDTTDPLSGYANEFCSTQITFTLEEHGIKVRLNLDSVSLSKVRAERILQQLEHVLRQLCAPEVASHLVQDLTMASEGDLRDILTWNAELFASTDAFVDDFISQTMRRQPNAQAVNSWDGELSYGQLDSMSAQLAQHLIRLGIGPEVVVPLFFEKSVWTPVAILAVMRARGASVMLDVTQPEDRLRMIVEKVGQSIILSSTSTMNLAASLFPSATVIAVDRDFLESLESLQSGQSLQHPLPRDPANLLYLVFTSGSTGTPKGVSITHANMCSTFTYQSQVISLSTSSRVLDWGSYAFDLSWYTVLQTFYSGAVLCIPRQGYDVSEAIKSLRPNFITCTPTGASILNDEALRSLETIELVGEVANPALIARVQDSGRTLRNSYGPCECTTLACVSNDAFRHATHIGYGFGARTWIVDPSGQHIALVGSVGELWLEGPIVGRGYYNDEERTRHAFVENPSWMISEGPEDICRLAYRTGDLVRYEEDGSLVFMGRKDSQVKIHGQRLELGEVEYHIRQVLDEVSLLAEVVVETFQPKDGERPVVVAFVAPAGWMMEVLNAAVPELTRGLNEQLAKRVASFMIPPMYIPIASVPLTTTGKTDRKRLRELAASVMVERLACVQHPQAPEKPPPRTPAEKHLRRLWASTLGMDEEKISADDSFLSLGGDSLNALQLVAVAAEQGMSFSMADIFRQPVLSDLALRMVATDETRDGAAVPPFFMLPGDIPRDFLEQHILPQLPHDRGNIHDVYRVSHIQELLLLNGPMTSAIRPSNFYIMDFAATLDIRHLEEILTSLVNHFDILRTLFVQVEGSLYQVVLETWRAPIELQEVAQDIEIATNQVWKDDHYNNLLQLGRPLLRFFILRSKDIVRVFVKFHHAQCDAIALTHLVPAFGALYRGETLPTVPYFSSYIHHATHRNRKAVYSYWESVLRGSTMTSVDSPPKSLEGKARAELIISKKKTLHMPSVANITNFTPPTIFTAACALMLTKMTGSRDVVFGKVVSGRHSLPSDCQTLVGPCITVIPVRFKLDEDDGPAKLLQSAHDQYLDAIPYETVGIDQIIANCTDWPDTVNDFWCVAGYRTHDPPPETDIGGSRVAWKIYERPEPIPQVPAFAVELTAVADGEDLHINLDASSQACDEQTVEVMLNEICAAVMEFSRGVLHSEDTV
jgi:amino acid adenylation domain-containing protein